MMYSKISLYYSTLRTFIKHPLYLYKLFKLRNNFTDRLEFYVTHTLKTVQKELDKLDILTIDSISKNRILSHYYFTYVYAFCRMLKPSTVVETGVGAGLSSTFILQALHENGFGELYSIDIPRAIWQSDEGKEIDESLWMPEGKTSGWLIPNDLRRNWTLILGKSVDKLPKILKKLEIIDLFLHDSEHTYKNMMWEYKTVWPYLRSNGILASHDIHLNNAFLDFAKQVNCTPTISRDCLGFIIRE